MGAFFLVRKLPGCETDSLCNTLHQQLSRQGFKSPHLIQTRDYSLYLYGKLSAAREPEVYTENDDFCIYTGTLLYKGSTGKEALSKFFREFDPIQPEPAQRYGAFCIIIRKMGRTFVFTDRLGIYKVYHDQKMRVWSSSFLAVLSSVGQPHIETQCIYEYVFQGATYGNDTVIKEVRILDRNRICEINNECTLQNIAESSWDRMSPESFDNQIDRTLSGLGAYYSDIARCFGNNIDTALTGGYDSRLTLSLLLEQGVMPKIHVYGRPHDPDVIIAKNIADGEGLALVHTDKQKRNRVEIENYANTIEHNYYFFDGYPPDGIFRDDTDRLTRADRCRSGELMLNGGGGEIYRNFFYLRDSSYSIFQFLWSFYGRFDPRTCTSAFSTPAYYSRLAEKVRSTLGITHNRLHRSEIEALYPLFRCRYWMGRNNSINNRLAPTLTPFIDYEIVRNAARIPLRYKNYGRFEARLIQKLNPQLAKYPSAYGHDFCKYPSVQHRIRDFSTLVRPPWLRKYTHRIRTRLKAPDIPYPMSPRYLEAVLGCENFYMSYFFRVARIRDADQLNRIYTLEYLFQNNPPDTPETMM